MTPEISANIGNIKADCGAPKSVTENQNSSDGLVANYTSTKPQVKSGMSITESIKSKMPLIDEGYKCVYFTEVNGADCTENAVRIQNSCRQSMKVQLKTTNGSDIHTVPANGVKTVKVGCDQKVKFAAIPANSNTNNLLSDQEWFLINVIDKTGKARVNVPYESPKPVVKQIASNSGNPSQSNSQNGVNTNSVNSGSSSNGSSGFDLTNGYFAAEGPYGSYKKFWIYRFSNQSWQQGNNWFRNIEQNHDSNGGGGDASMDWNFWGSWELVGNQVKLKRWQAGVNNPEQLIFKIEGKDLRLVKYITHWGKESTVNVLYKHYVNMPPWPIRNHLVSVLTSNFPPR